MLDKIINILKQYSDASDVEITGETNLQTDLGLNSFDVMSIIVEFEDAFGVEIPDEDIIGLLTVNDIEKYLTKKGAKI